MASDDLKRAREMWVARLRSLVEVPDVDPALPFMEQADKLLQHYKRVIDSNVHNYETLRRLLFKLRDPEPVSSYRLTKGQRTALDALASWLRSQDPYFILKGYAGTGKTYVVSVFAQGLSKDTTIFSAPTNKATRVLRRLLPYHSCRTIYSALSLKMVEREDELILEASEDRFNLNGIRLVVVDEASMLNSELLGYIERAVQDYGIKFLFVCDDAQLPPVGEDTSPVVTLPGPTVSLTEVVRHDNQILDVATQIRNSIVRNKPLEPITLEERDKKCVWRLSGTGFIDRIRKAARSTRFVDIKAIAWRNRTVDRLNAIIRQELYSPSELARSTWLPNDQIVFTEPAEDHFVQAATDEEGVVISSDIGIDPETDLRCYFLQIKLEGGESIRIRVIHESALNEFQDRLGKMAAAARKPGQGKLWKDFWALRRRFTGIRHSYAITAHRAQGSTFRIAFVDAGDILSNPDRATAHRCLYVAVTRPSERLYLTGLST